MMADDFFHVDARNPYRELLFPLGFLASPNSIPLVKPGWRQVQLRGLNLSFDPKQPHSVIGDKRHFVVVLGPMVSLNHDTVDHHDLTLKLFEELAYSEQAFFDELDAISGRFVCFYCLDGKIRVLNDATGMKMVYYAVSPQWTAGSHAPLVAAYAGKKRSPHAETFLKEAGVATYNMSYLPGHATRFEDVRILGPNTFLEVGCEVVQRYFPREQLHSISHEHAVASASAMARDLMGKFARLAPLAVSLTAGLDSRLTTAASRHVHHGTRFFSYVRRGDKVNTVDAVVARRIACSLALDLDIMFFDHEISADDSQFDDFLYFKDVALSCLEFEHFLPLTYAYLKNWPDGRLHVRSNIGEICRARYHGDPFAKLARGGSLLDKYVAFYNRATKAADHPFIRAEITRYFAETGVPDQLHGYDVKALLYWELLMCAWHGTVVLESSFSHDTVSIYNCRKLLSTFVAAPFESQISKRCMLDVIGELWPALLDEPINPSLSEISDHEADRLGDYACQLPSEATSG